MKRVPRHVYWTEAEYKEVRAHVQKMGISMSDYARQAVINQIKKEKRDGATTK